MAPHPVPRQSVLNSGGKFLGEGLGSKSLKSKPDLSLGPCLGGQVYSEAVGAVKATGSPRYPMTGQGWKEAASGLRGFACVSTFLASLVCGERGREHLG